MDGQEQKKLTFIKFIFAEPLYRALPLVIIPLYRLFQSGFIIDCIGAFVLTLLSLYIWYRLETNEKTKDILHKINQRGGTIALIAVGLFILLALLSG